MWEILEYGKLPYHTLKNNEVMDQVPNGLRLGKPSSCPTDLWEIVLPIWNQKPKERPSFSQLVKKLNKIKRLHDDSKKVDGSVPKEEGEPPYQILSEYKKIDQLGGEYDKTPDSTIDGSNQYDKTPELTSDEPVGEFVNYQKTPKDV